MVEDPELEADLEEIREMLESGKTGVLPDEPSEELKELVASIKI